METLRNQILIAQLSARLIVEEGINNYAQAKRKASERLGLDWRKYLPDDESVTAALLEYHRIFRFQQQPEFIQNLRKIALELMEFLAEFAPRLTGPALEGTAGEHNPIILQLFPETPEDVFCKLRDYRIPFRQAPDLMTKWQGKRLEVPVLSLTWKGRVVELRLYPWQKRKLNPRNGPPSASIKMLRRIVTPDD